MSVASSTSAPSRKRGRSPDAEELAQSALVGEPRQTYEFKQMDELIEVYKQNIGDRDAEDTLECVPRAYEDDYLREPVGSERHCINDDQCQGLKISNCTGFVLREFLLPSQESKPAEGSRQMCLMCRRYEVARIFYRYQALGRPACEKTSIAGYYNLVGVDGEYNIRDCIVSHNGYSGLKMPIVLHTKGAYTQHSNGGVRFFRQTAIRFADSDESKPGPFLARRATLDRAATRVALST